MRERQGTRGAARDGSERHHMRGRLPMRTER